MDARVAIVTGGAYGIGRGICRLFAKRGDRVLIGDIDDARGQALECELRDSGAEARFVHANVRDEASVRAMVDAAVAAWGRIDTLVNNAGIEKYAEPSDFTLEDWEAIVGTNLRGVFLCSRAAFPHLREARGAVVNIASVQAFANVPKLSVYAATKGGVMALTRSMALDWAPQGVRVNAVCPGAIYTGMTETELAGSADPDAEVRAIGEAIPMGRIGQPEDVASAVYFLASEDAAYVTGAALVVDGGLLTKISA